VSACRVNLAVAAHEYPYLSDVGPVNVRAVMSRLDRMAIFDDFTFIDKGWDLGINLIGTFVGVLFGYSLAVRFDRKKQKKEHSDRVEGKRKLVVQVLTGIWDRLHFVAMNPGYLSIAPPVDVPHLLNTHLFTEALELFSSDYERYGKLVDLSRQLAILQAQISLAAARQEQLDQKAAARLQEVAIAMDGVRRVRDFAAEIAMALDPSTKERFAGLEEMRKDALSRYR